MIDRGHAISLHLNGDPLRASAIDDSSDSTVLDNLGGSVVEGGDRLLVLDEEERGDLVAVGVILSERGREGGGGESVELDLEAQNVSRDVQRERLDVSGLLSDGNAEAVQSVGLGDESL